MSNICSVVVENTSLPLHGKTVPTLLSHALQKLCYPLHIHINNLISSSP